jgi:hypothetical protein
LKRNALLHQNVHLVELDLLLGGKPLPTRQPLPRGHYHHLVSRAELRPNCQVYSWNLSHPLPVLPVPLRSPYSDVVFDLATVFAVAYDRGRFAKRIRYGQPCQAPMSEQDRDWVAALVREHCPPPSSSTN